MIVTRNEIQSLLRRFPWPRAWPKDKHRFAPREEAVNVLSMGLHSEVIQPGMTGEEAEAAVREHLMIGAPRLYGEDAVTWAVSCLGLRGA